MFYVHERSKDNNEKPQVKTVYGVQYKHGYPFFTFYEDGIWVTRSAKHYVPVANENEKLNKKLVELQLHLDEISIEEFEKNLEACGMGRIKKCEEDFITM